MMRALVILALILQPLMGLARGAPCCDSTGERSACCLQIAHAVCASAKAEPACCAGDACDHPAPGGALLGHALGLDPSCEPCRVACRLLCGSGGGPRAPASERSTRPVFAGADVGVAMTVPAPLGAPSARWAQVPRGAGPTHPPPTLRRLAILCVWTT